MNRSKAITAADNARAIFQCFASAVNDNALVKPGIGHAIRDYEDRFQVEFNKLLDAVDLDKDQIGFQRVEYPK